MGAGPVRCRGGRHLSLQSRNDPDIGGVLRRRSRSASCGSDRVNRGILLLRVISLGALAACMAAPSLAVDGQTAIAFAETRIGMPPADFDLGVTGHGQPGKWTIVRDESAAGGLAIEQSSDDPTDDRFDFAVYQSLSLKSLAPSTRFKLITGTMKSAGLVFRFQNASSHYVLCANALEGRVDVFRVQGSEMKRVSGTDADVVLN